MTVMSCVLTRVAVIVLTRTGALEHLTPLHRPQNGVELLSCSGKNNSLPYQDKQEILHISGGIFSVNFQGYPVVIHTVYFGKSLQCNIMKDNWIFSILMWGKKICFILVTKLKVFLGRIFFQNLANFLP